MGSGDRPARAVTDDDTRGEDYDRRFEANAAAGLDVHGEARFVEDLGVRSVLDAGCGTGRVAIELSRRGLAVAGVDVDPAMISTARRKAAELDWHLRDLATFDLGTTWDVAVMAGNVMIFVEPGTEGEVLRRVAVHVSPGGLVVAGFQLMPGRLDLDRYDQLATAAGLELAERYATWDRQPFIPGGDYAVSVHQRSL